MSLTIEHASGPYDELMFIYGFYNVNASIKDKPKTVSRLRITWIYVSTEASIYNGEIWHAMYMASASDYELRCVQGAKIGIFPRSDCTAENRN